MTASPDSFSLNFPLKDSNDANNIALIVKRFEDEGLLLRVELLPDDEYSAVIAAEYMMDEFTEKEPLPFMQFLIEKQAKITLKMHLRV